MHACMDGCMNGAVICGGAILAPLPLPDSVRQTSLGGNNNQEPPAQKQSARRRDLISLVDTGTTKPGLNYPPEPAAADESFAQDIGTPSPIPIAAATEHLQDTS